MRRREFIVTLALAPALKSLLPVKPEVPLAPPELIAAYKSAWEGGWASCLAVPWDPIPDEVYKTPYRRFYRRTPA